jgi:hypothetical protein
MRAMLMLWHAFLFLGLSVEGGGSSRAVTRLHTVIGLTGYRTRDLLRIRRALYRKARDQVNFVDVDGNDILQRRC